MTNKQITKKCFLNWKNVSVLNFFLMLTLCFSLPVLAASPVSDDDGVTSGVIQAEGDSPWILFTAAQISATPKTYWGAGSYACCTTKATTFYLTQGTVTKTAINATCGPDDTSFEGWVTGLPQEKAFSWVYESCSGKFHGNFTYTLEDDKQYLFFVDWVNGGPKLYVSISDTLSSSSMQTMAFSKENRIPVETEIYATVQADGQANYSSTDQSEF